MDSKFKSLNLFSSGKNSTKKTFQSEGVLVVAIKVVFVIVAVTTTQYWFNLRNLE